MSIVGRYTRQTVPDGLLLLPVQSKVLSLEVLNAGPMAGTNLTPEEAVDHGQMKNHWRWHVLVPGDGDKTFGVTFGFDPDETPSVKSDVTQYTPSSQGGSGPGSDNDRFSFYEDENEPVRDSPVGSEGKSARYSPVGSEGKPPALSDPGSPVKPVVTNHEIGATVVSAPASISSISGDIIRQPVEGRPVRGVFNIKVVDRTTVSANSFVVFELPLADGLKFGDLIRTLDERGMESFFFRKIGFAIFGCRDFIFNSAAQFIAKGFTTGFVEKEEKHIFELLGWRYTKARDAPGTISLKSNPAVSCAENPVDRAVWPRGFIAHVDEMDRVKFNQVAIPS